MKLVLCSAFRILDLNKIFEETFGQNVRRIKVLYIPFANPSSNKNVDTYISQCCDIFEKYGVVRENIEILTDKTSKQNTYDCIFVGGGNNQLLKKRLIETGWWENIIKRVNQNVLYIGDSAGSVICGKDVGFSLEYEDLIDGITDYTGFSFLDKYILAHYSKIRVSYTKGEYLDEITFEIKSKIAEKLGKENCVTLNDREYLYYKV